MPGSNRHLTLQRPFLRGRKQHQHDTQDHSSGTVHYLVQYTEPSHHHPTNLSDYETARKDLNTLEEPHGADEDEEYAKDGEDGSHRSVPESRTDAGSQSR